MDYANSSSERYLRRIHQQLPMNISPTSIAILRGLLSQLPHTLCRMLFIVAVPSCQMSSPNHPSVHHSAFTQGTVAAVAPGLLPDEIELLFGPPDERRISTYGSRTGAPWQGLEYTYKMGTRKANRFVFTMTVDPPLLNHFDMEVIHPGPASAHAAGVRSRLAQRIGRSETGAPKGVGTRKGINSLVDSRFEIVGRGTAFFLNGVGILATAKHLVQDVDYTTAADPLRLFIRLESGAMHEAMLWPDCTQLDVAILCGFDLNENGEFTPITTDHWLPLASSEDNAVGTEVFTFGYPLPEEFGTRAQFDQGVVTRIESSRQLLQFSMTVLPGSSGGPIVSLETGTVVGMVLARANEAYFQEKYGLVAGGVGWGHTAGAVIDVLRSATSEDAPDLADHVISQSSPFDDGQYDRSAIIENARLATCQVFVVKSLARGEAKMPSVPPE